MEKTSMLDSFLFSFNAQNNERTKNTLRAKNQNNEVHQKERVEPQTQNRKDEKVKYWPYPKSVRILLPKVGSAGSNVKISNFFSKKTQSLENASQNQSPKIHEYRNLNNLDANRKETTQDKHYLPKLLHSLLSTTSNTTPRKSLSIPVQQVLPKKFESPSRTWFDQKVVKESFKIKSTEPVPVMTEPNKQRKKRFSAPYMREKISIIDQEDKKSQKLKNTHSYIDMKALMSSRCFPRSETMQLLQSKRPPKPNPQPQPPQTLPLSQPQGQRNRTQVYPPNATGSEGTNYSQRDRPPNLRNSPQGPGPSRDVETQRDRPKHTRDANQSSSDTIASEDRRPRSFRTQPSGSASLANKKKDQEDIRLQNLRPVQLSPHTVEYLPLDPSKLVEHSENILETIKKKEKKETGQKQ